ncbi:MAG: NmrA family NAD(P)-binding protein [Rubrobacter sp.]|nr:NmrA family NAD(P)-binding protein [Rubrobacter sp.]
MSVQGAGRDHPMELARSKYAAEQELKASGLAWTIIRPTAYMETWAVLVGEPLLKTGKTRIFGRGNDPINFVSAHDVARFVEVAVIDPAMRGEVVEVGGPENLTMKQFAQTFEAVSGSVGKTRHVPLPMMRLMSAMMRPVNPTLARQVRAGVVMDTEDMSFDPTKTGRRYPSIPLTSLAEAVRRDYGG